VAVVAAGVGGLPEIVGDGESGVLAPPADPRATAPLIRGVLDSRPQREALAMAALQRARQEYTADRFAARHRALYDRLVGAD
jgi:glycosyltransferase involved in cell wall biosynthesis